MNVKVLVIEQQGEIRRLLQRRLSHDLFIESVPAIELAREKFHSAFYNIVVCDADARPSERSKAIRFLEKLSEKFPQTKLFIVADSGAPQLPGIEKAPYRWLQRPIEEVSLCALIGASLPKKTQVYEADFRDPEVFIPTDFEGILAVSLTMRTVIQRMQEAAAVDVPVLIIGETGTGKDLVASAIHKRSKRKNFPYVPVNMGAISPQLIASELFGHDKGAYTGAFDKHAGIFEQGRGGTVFLDEITTMDEKTQISLLRVLETKTVRRVGGDKDNEIDARIIAATNENIEEAVKARRFREDLYYRLDVFRIHIPPLRERPAGMSFLTDHFIAYFDAIYKKNIRMVSAQTYRLLRQYPWPGNVRELKNVIQRAVLLAKGEELTPDLLPARFREQDGAQAVEGASPSPIHLGMNLADVEREFIKMTLGSVNGNKKKAASILGISRRALYNKLKRFDLF